MALQNLTKEFSICLIPEPRITEIVEILRRDLPPSPYRVDPPHITLLRRIKSTTLDSDHQLMHELNNILQLSEHLPLKAKYKAVETWPNPVFKYFSCSIVLKSSEEMKIYRKYIIAKLHRSGFSLNTIDSALFLPHITISLGVRLSSTTRKIAMSYFRENEELSFNDWRCFRTVRVEGKRLIHEVKSSEIGNEGTLINTIAKNHEANN